MGSYDNVTFVTTKEGYEVLMKEMERANVEFKVAEESAPLLARDIRPFTLDHIEGCVVFGWPSIKWYSEFREVQAVASSLQKIEEEGYPVEKLIIREMEVTEYSGTKEGLKVHVEPYWQPFVWAE